MVRSFFNYLYKLYYVHVKVKNKRFCTIVGSLSVEAAKQRWKQLRDSYMKARKKMQGYVRSGSGAESGHPSQSSFAHYEQMRFLDDAVKTRS